MFSPLAPSPTAFWGENSQLWVRAGKAILGPPLLVQDGATLGEGPEVTAGQKGPKNPIVSQKNEPPKRRALGMGPAASTRVPVGVTPSPSPPGSPLSPRAARRAHGGAASRGYIWKRIWKPFQQICAKGTSGPFPEPPKGRPRARGPVLLLSIRLFVPRKRSDSTKTPSSKFCLPKPQERRPHATPAKPLTLCQPDLLVLS